MKTITEADALIAFCRARLAEAASPLDLAVDAGWPGLPEGITLDEARRRTSAALAAAGIDGTPLVLCQTIALYEQTQEHILAMAGHGIDAEGSKIAVESYLNVIRLHAAAHWPGHADYEPRFRTGWMDDLPV